MTKSFIKNRGPFSLYQLAKLINSKVFLAGKEVMLNEEYFVTDVATLEDATRSEISFCANSKYLAQYSSSFALACVTKLEYLEKAPNETYILVSANPYADFAKITNLFYPDHVRGEYEAEISVRANIDPSARIGKNCLILDGCYIGKNVTIGDNCVINCGVYIADNCCIGNNSTIHHNVTINHAIIGNNAIIHSGVRIGQDGFGYAFENGVHYKVPQIGRVVIGKDVEIGANSTIDRGAISDTIIGDMCKIDNLVQIGHNVKLGRGCIVVSQVGISGSTEIGDYSVIGGQAGIAGHLKIGNAVQIAAQSGVASDITDKQIVGGTPAVPIRQWHKQSIILKKLTGVKND